MTKLMDEEEKAIAAAEEEERRTAELAEQMDAVRTKLRARYVTVRVRSTGSSLSDKYLLANPNVISICRRESDGGS